MLGHTRTPLGKPIEVRNTHPSLIYCSMAGETLYSARSLTTVPISDDRGLPLVGTDKSGGCTFRTGEGKSQPTRKWLVQRRPKTQYGTLVDSYKLGTESQIQHVASPCAIPICFPHSFLQPRLS